MIYVLIGFVALFCVYIGMENTHRFWPATTLKLILTTTLAVCLWVSVFRNYTVINLFFAIGMTLAIAGDYFLQYIIKDIPKFKFGIYFFIGTHISYLIALHMIQGFRWWHLIPLVVGIVIILTIKKVQRWDTSDAEPWISIYTAIVAATAAKGFSLLFVPEASSGIILLGIGCIMFYISDVILGVWKYSNRKMIIADFNWLFYFAGQFCVAAGVVSMF